MRTQAARAFCPRLQAWAGGLLMIRTTPHPLPHPSVLETPENCRAALHVGGGREQQAVGADALPGAQLAAARSIPPQAWLRRETDKGPSQAASTCACIPMQPPASSHSRGQAERSAAWFVPMCPHVSRIVKQLPGRGLACAAAAHLLPVELASLLRAKPAAGSRQRGKGEPCLPQCHSAQWGTWLGCRFCTVGWLGGAAAASEHRGLALPTLAGSSLV